MIFEELFTHLYNENFYAFVYVDNELIYNGSLDNCFLYDMFLEFVVKKYSISFEDESIIICC